MAKRFTSTEIWEEDWFLEMPMEYKLFWYYMLSTCDHAGLFKVNLRSFCGLNGCQIDADKAVEFFNNGKNRIRVLNKSVWYIEDFFVFQYGTTVNTNNRLHASIEKLYNKFDLNLTSIRGVKDHIDGVKDKDKDKDINTVKHKKTENGKHFVNFKAQGEELFADRDKRFRDKTNGL